VSCASADSPWCPLCAVVGRLLSLARVACFSLARGLQL
jgi:hypothetical protein